MRNEWREIQDFPNYFVNPLAQIMNGRTESLLVATEESNYGSLSIVLFKGSHGYRRSLAKVVAFAFIAKPTHWCDTPIHLDGDRGNCVASNLMWRPRHIAVKYHRQQANLPIINNPKKVQNITTGEMFENVQEAARAHGLLIHDLVDYILNGTPSWPDKHRFIFT
jgi:hypothetical protein